MGRVWHCSPLLWLGIVALHVPVLGLVTVPQAPSVEATSKTGLRLAAIPSDQVAALHEIKKASEPHSQEETRAEKTKGIQIEVEKVLVVFAMIGFIALVGLAAWGAWYWSSRDWSSFVEDSARSGSPRVPGEDQQPEQVVRSSTTEMLRKGVSTWIQPTEHTPISFDDWCDAWEQMAGTGALDIYTCMGLRNGFGHFGHRTRKFLPTVALLVAMQFILPLLLAMYEFKHFQWHPENGDMTFRCIAFILYVFSVMHLYFGALDTCRTLFLEMSFDHNVSWWFLLPMLMGELMNSFTSFVLTAVLFMVFCTETSAVELVIKSVAINFVVVVDNEWTSEQMRTDAIQDFKAFREQVPEWDVEEVPDEMSFSARKESRKHRPAVRTRNVLHCCIKFMCVFMRGFGTLFVGAFLAFTLLLARQATLCQEFRQFVPGIVCGG